MQKVKMLKTLYPTLIPNGTLGEIVRGDDITTPGLSMAKFNRISVLVYPNEVELIEVMDYAKTKKEN